MGPHALVALLALFTGTARSELGPAARRLVDKYHSEELPPFEDYPESVRPRAYRYQKTRDHLGEDEDWVSLLAIIEKYDEEMAVLQEELLANRLGRHLKNTAPEPGSERNVRKDPEGELGEHIGDFDPPISFLEQPWEPRKTQWPCSCGQTKCSCETRCEQCTFSEGQNVDASVIEERHAASFFPDSDYNTKFKANDPSFAAPGGGINAKAHHQALRMKMSTLLEKVKDTGGSSLHVPESIGAQGLAQVQAKTIKEMDMEDDEDTQVPLTHAPIEDAPLRHDTKIKPGGKGAGDDGWGEVNEDESFPDAPFEKADDGRYIVGRMEKDNVSDMEQVMLLELNGGMGVNVQAGASPTPTPDPADDPLDEGWKVEDGQKEYKALMDLFPASEGWLQPDEDTGEMPEPERPTSFHCNNCGHVCTCENECSCDLPSPDKNKCIGKWENQIKEMSKRKCRYHPGCMWHPYPLNFWSWHCVHWFECPTCKFELKRHHHNWYNNFKWLCKMLCQCQHMCVVEDMNAYWNNGAGN